MNYQKKLEAIVKGIKDGDIEAKINFNVKEFDEKSIGDYYEISIVDKPNTTVATKQIKRLPLVLLSGLLGTLGVHNFYAGYSGRGFAQLILTMTFIGAIISAPWAFIEFILALAGKFKDKAGNEVKEW